MSTHTPLPAALGAADSQCARAREADRPTNDGVPTLVGDTPTVTAGRLLTADELAERWQVPKAHVYRLTREGRLPTVKLGRYCRYRVGAVEEWEQRGGSAANV